MFGKFFVLPIGILQLGLLFRLFQEGNAQSLSLCPPGWNETDYRCYRLLDISPQSFEDADAACGALGVGARVAYPADYYELAMISSIADGVDVWLGYISDGIQYKTFYNAIGFENMWGSADLGRCGYYKNIADPGDPALYQVSSDLCTQNHYALCQMSYCSPITTAPNPEFLWIEWKLHCFYLNPTPMKYLDAETWCESNAGVLATPDLNEENDFLTRIFPNTASKKRWIGIKSEYTSDTTADWRSVETGSYPAVTFWQGDTQPSKPTTNTSCVYMEGTKIDNWGVGSCGTTLPFVCRRVLGSLSYKNCTKGIMGKYSAWSADCTFTPGSQTRRWRKCISMCQPSGCSHVTAKYCQYQPKWSEWGPWGGCVKPSKGSYQMASTPCIFYGQRSRTRSCMCGTEACGGCGSSGDSAGGTQNANCNIYDSTLCPSEDCTYCSTQFTNTHCYEDGSADSLTNNFRCVCNLGYYKYYNDIAQGIPMGCHLNETSDDSAAECGCSYSYNECMTDYHSCTSEQLCQYPEGGPHTCYCKPGYRMIPSGGCVAASRIPPQCKIVSGSSFLKNNRGNPLIPYERGYICTCGEKQALIDAGYSTRNSTTGEEAAARVVSRNDRYMCYCLRATVGPFLRTDDVTNRPVETKFNLTRQFMLNFPECEMGYFDDNITYPQIPADLFVDVDAKLADLQKRTYFKCTGAEGFNSRFEYLTQPVLGEALSPPLEEPASEEEAFLRLLSVDEAAVDLFQSMLSPDCETQRSYLGYVDVMSGTEVFIGNVSSTDTDPTKVYMGCGNWSFPPQAVDRSKYPGAYQPLLAHCYLNATRFKSNIYNSTAIAANKTTLAKFLKNNLRQKTLSFTYNRDEFELPVPMINSAVLSISTNPPIKRFPADYYLEIWFPLYQPLEGHYKPHCTFYDFNYINGPSWRTKESGCITEFYNNTNGIGFVHCSCNHMTIYAVTMVEVIPDEYLLAAAILNAIVVGGSAMSILCLAFTLLIYIQLRRFSTERVGIMILCFTIGMTQALLLAGAKLTVSPSTCRIISICLHYFGLLTFFLIGSLSLAMFFRFVTKFQRGWLNLLAYYGLGFVIPTVVVAISAGGFYSSYGVGYSCWMDMDGMIKWAFFVPFMLIGLFALYLLIRVAPVLYRVRSQKKKSFSQQEVYGAEFKYGVEKRATVEVIFETNKKKFWGLIILLVILTVTWILGVLSMQYESIYYEYGFAIFNASQGFFIFIMFCIREEEVRILCCAGCMTKQQPAGKITWGKFVEIYERYFALVLHNEEKEKKQMTFNEFVSQEYQSGALNPGDITEMEPREYVSAQRGLARPNYLLSCNCCFPVKTAPLPPDLSGQLPVVKPPPMDLTNKLFVVGPDGQLMCLDKNGENAGEIMQEFGPQRPGSMAVVTGSADPRGRSGNQNIVDAPIAHHKPHEAALGEKWIAPPTLFPEFPDSEEEGEVEAEIVAEVKINKVETPASAAPAPPPPKPKAPSPPPPPPPPPPAPESRPVSAAKAQKDEANTDDEIDPFDDDEVTDWAQYASDRPVSASSRPRSASSRSGSAGRKPSSGTDDGNWDDDDDDGVPVIAEEDEQPEKPTSAKPKQKKETDELDPLALEDDDY